MKSKTNQLKEKTKQMKPILKQILMLLSFSFVRSSYQSLFTMKETNFKEESRWEQTKEDIQQAPKILSRSKKKSFNQNHKRDSKIRCQEFKRDLLL